MIYFVRCQARNAIKIGTADDPAARLRGLQTACPDDLELLGSIPGSESEERALHRKFAELRIRGEWFRAEQSLIGFIELHTNHDLFKDMPKITHDRKDIYQLVKEGHQIENWMRKRLGFAVQIYQGVEPWMTGAEDRSMSYQIMPADEDDCEAFWIWQADCEQWFATIEEAAKSFVLCFIRWLEIIAEEKKPA